MDAKRGHGLKQIFFCIALLLLALGRVQAQSTELLEPQKAFAFSAEVTTPERVSFTWKIADGYYMYKNKFGARVVEGPATIGELSLPVAKTKSDEFFGEQEIYTDNVVIHAPIERKDAGAPQTILVEVTGQGCNEPIGVCYPPLKQTATLQLAALPVATESELDRTNDLSKRSSKISSLSTLKDLLQTDQGQPEFLHPDQAFKIDLQAEDARNVLARFAIAEGYYLYRDKISFESKTEGLALAGYQLPPGIKKEDEYFGLTETYYDGFTVLLPLERQPHVGDKASLLVTYQGCAEKGICYPPIKKNVVLDLLPIDTAQAALSSPTGKGSGGPNIDSGFWGYVLGAFGVGLLLTFTPCVLPLVPIMSSFIVGQSGDVTRARGGTLSMVYVLGTAVTYTAAGVLAGASGDQLQAYFQNIWFVGFVSIVLIVLALSMFGLYDIQMPSGVQSRLQQKTESMAGGQLAMVFTLGIISALIVGACVSPLLVGALGVAIVKGDPLLGGAIMFSMALGMGFFLVLLGLGLGTLLPKAGPWMDYIKYGFGVILLGTAIYLLGNIAWVPVLYLWSVLLIVTAVFCGVFQSLPPGVSGWRYLAKGLGVFLLVWGVLALMGGMSGNRDILQPIDIANWGRTAAESDSAHVEFIRVQNVSDLDARLERARLDQKPVMLDYYADWCVDCVRMEKSTFNDTQVARVLEDFVLVQVDVTNASDESTNAVKKRYGVYGPPAMLFFDRNGQERDELRRYGFMPPAEFLNHVAQL